MSLNSITVGIDRISFSTSQYYIDLRTLAENVGTCAQKYYQGLRQQKMSVTPPNEDIVTLAANAAQTIVATEPNKHIGILLLGTESSIDQSKSAGVYVHRLLGLSKYCRVVELKQACYSGTAGLLMACDFVRQNPDQSALVIATDIARYERNTPAEPTQGSGAVAMLVSANPKILEIAGTTSAYVDDVMDFWRPNYRREPLVDGKYSTNVYLDALQKCWERFKQLSELSLNDYYSLLFHVPFCKMAHKALNKLAENESVDEKKFSAFQNKIEQAIQYNTIVGNCYTASLYLSLLSLLENAEESLAKKRIGLFSYGSGCTAEFFTGVVQEGYHQYLYRDMHQKHLSERIELNYEQYVKMHDHHVNAKDNAFVPTGDYSVGSFAFVGINSHQRHYQAVDEVEYAYAG